jgi:hypothetical protein
VLAGATGGSGNGKLSHRRTSFSSRDSPRVRDSAAGSKPVSPRAARTSTRRGRSEVIARFRPAQEGRSGGRHTAASVSDLEGLDPGGDPRRSLRVLRPRTTRLADVHGAPAGPLARRRRARHRPLHRGRHQQGPAGVPSQRVDGVRLGLRPRCVPRARLLGGLPAPIGRSRSRLLRRRSVRAARAEALPRGQGPALKAMRSTPRPGSGSAAMPDSSVFATIRP